MGVENPLLNFRLRTDLRDLVSLHAKQLNKPVGALCRQYLLERIAFERFAQLLKSVDVPEVLRRLSVPSGVMTAMDCSTTVGDGLQQTSDNFVRQPEEPVLQDTRKGRSVLHGKQSKNS